MSESKHTTGPWEIVFGETNKNAAIWYTPAGLSVEYSKPIALVHNQKDASLIAGAPELLEACKRLLNAFPDGKSPWECLDNDINFAKKAIAKADGRA